MKISFNYYGYDKETYLSCKEMIDEANLRHAEIINAWFFLTCLLFTVFSVSNLFGASRQLLFVYAGFTAVALAFQILFVAGRDFVLRHMTLLAFINSIIIMYFGIAQSEAQRFLPATLFPVLAAMIAISYISTMVKMSAAGLIFASMFLYLSFAHKPLSVATQDLYNMVIVLILCEMLHYVFSRARIRQFVTYHENIQITQELEIKSSFDALTSLLNRGRFFSMAGDALRGRGEDEYICVALLDLDEFKQINDKLGHQMGDKVIQTMGETITNALSIDESEKWTFTERTLREKTSFAGRLGGDEFIVFLRGMNDRAQVMAAMQDLLSALHSVEIGDSGEVRGIRSSIGVVEVTPDVRDMDRIYSKADELLYEAKEAGRDRIRFSE